MDSKRAAEIRSRFIRFADEEARDRSPLYEALARGVAGDRYTIDFLSALPAEKRQPNLLLAAVRHLFGTPAGWTDFRTRLMADPDLVRAFMLTHSTQTNEPARCATLLPLLARLPQPLALIEVGASAGLCLLLDRYGYDYGHKSVRPVAPAADFPVFRCSANHATPVPDDMPEVIWRAGLDLNPLDVSDPSQAAWLESLVWPEQALRHCGLRKAMKVASEVRPLVLRGNLLGTDLASLCGEAPKNATLVVFHTAVLAYVADREEREAFAAQVMRLCDYWISNESPRVFPDIASRTRPPGTPRSFLQSVNGVPLAWVEPHGACVEWIEDGVRAMPVQQSP